MTSIVCGPSGGLGGKEFLDVVPSESTPGSIRISAEVRGIFKGFVRSVQFGYVVNGTPIDLPFRGLLSDQAGTYYTISLGPTAYVSAISGRCGKFVDSIRVTTVRDWEGADPRIETQEFGGGESAAEFSYQAPPDYEIAGFCGRSSDVIHAIGVVFRPLAERGQVTAAPQGVGSLGQLVAGVRTGLGGKFADEGTFGDGRE